MSVSMRWIAMCCSRWRAATLQAVALQAPDHLCTCVCVPVFVSVSVFLSVFLRCLYICVQVWARLRLWRAWRSALWLVTCPQGCWALSCWSWTWQHWQRAA